jgi:hypothetical protein
MAGKVQHEIPRLFLRGFLIPGGEAEQVYVYRKGKARPYPSNIDRVAAAIRTLLEFQPTFCA